MSDMITLPNAEVSIEINEQNYVFRQAISIEVNDPTIVDLLSSPQNNSDGIIHVSNLTQSASVNSVVREVPAKIQMLIQNTFNNLGRLKFQVIDLSNGKKLTAKKAVINSNPINGTIDENATVQDVRLPLRVTPKNLMVEFKDVS
ncbi:hypothetical protein [Photobacterium indicum]|uniref:Uncharacterized protein n=1 Tax=Photobacterium indicum TaxID=81447 RepID=A0A2T3LF73_9GAMM|nr:hypothetical protein [Photobacterium indicum]PSV50035.1 hypothetical protein C9J47_05655 [Photobacterium indicum]